MLLISSILLKRIIWRRNTRSMAISWEMMMTRQEKDKRRRRRPCPLRRIAGASWMLKKMGEKERLKNIR